MEMKSMKAKAIVAGMIIIGAVAGAITGAVCFPVKQENVVYKDKIVTVESVKVVNNTIEVPVEVVKEVPVDNGNLDLVLDYIYDNNGNVELETSGLKESEIGQIVDRINFVNDIKSLAVQEVMANGIDEMDKESVVNSSIVIDEDDVERFNVQDDSEDVLVDNVDFDDKDATVYVQAKFEQDNVDYIGNFKVKIKEGEVDEMYLVDVQVN